MKPLFNVLSLLLITFQAGWCQQLEGVKIHSHNDYEQSIPFWAAFSSGSHSIEVDIFLKNDTLYVTHEEAEIVKSRTIEKLYFKPIQQVLDQNFKGPDKLLLLVDIKSDAYVTLNKLISVLESYPDIITSDSVTIVISGNRPKPNEFVDYPAYIYFDYQNLEDVKSKAIWNKIELISLNFKKFSSWKGSGELPAKDSFKLKAVIDKAHAYSKPFRFWGTPDTEIAWQTFAKLGIDYINTDSPLEAAVYLEVLR